MGAGINLFRQLFPEDYYAYQTAHLESSKPVSKKIYDSNNQLIAEVALGGDELRGLLKVENGNLVAYGDIKPSDGNGTEVFDIVDLGSLTWEKQDIGGVYNFRTTLSDIKLVSDTVLPNIICAEYLTVTTENMLSVTGTDKAISTRSSTIAGIRIKDSAYNSSTAEQFKTAMSGKYLIYEKATPTSKSYTPFSNPMISGSTEEFTDSRSVKMFVGHDSLYYTSNFKYW